MCSGKFTGDTRLIEPVPTILMAWRSRKEEGRRAASLKRKGKRKKDKRRLRHRRKKESYEDRVRRANEVRLFFFFFSSAISPFFFCVFFSLFFPLLSISRSSFRDVAESQHCGHQRCLSSFCLAARPFMPSSVPVSIFLLATPSPPPTTTSHRHTHLIFLDGLHQRMSFALPLYVVGKRARGWASVIEVSKTTKKKESRYDPWHPAPTPFWPHLSTCLWHILENDGKGHTSHTHQKGKSTAQRKKNCGRSHFMGAYPDKQRGRGRGKG